MDLFVHGKAVSNPKNGRPQSAIIPNTPPAGYTGRKESTPDSEGFSTAASPKSLMRTFDHKYSFFRSNQSSGLALLF